MGQQTGMAAAKLQMPPSATLLRLVAKHGQKTLKQWKQLSRLPQPVRPCTEGLLGKASYFQANIHICAAFIQALHVLEVGTLLAARHATFAKQAISRGISFVKAVRETAPAVTLNCSAQAECECKCMQANSC